MTLMVGNVNHEKEQARWLAAWQVLYDQWTALEKVDD
jgi:hypothetical protein